MRTKLNSWMVRKFFRALRLNDQVWPGWFVGLARRFHPFPDRKHQVTMQKYAPVYRFLMAKSLLKRINRFKGGVWWVIVWFCRWPSNEWINPWTSQEGQVYLVSFLSFEPLVSLELLLSWVNNRVPGQSGLTIFVVFDQIWFSPIFWFSPYPSMFQSFNFPTTSKCGT